MGISIVPCPKSNIKIMPSAVPYLNLEDDSDIVSSDIYHFVSIPTHPFQLFWFSTFNKQNEKDCEWHQKSNTHGEGWRHHSNAVEVEVDICLAGNFRGLVESCCSDLGTPK
mmetsp:Transcript_73156/g.118694  ORF Transcript_73156/g.118694 Transcript_73156/m.118694 type:complete len:111 (-) Transcript_73156:2292-2624(-)